MAYNNSASKIVSDFIVEKIQDGTWLPGTKIWAENEFCKNLNVSRIAVRDAISKLSAKTVLKTIKGSGTYIEKKEEASLEGIRFFKMEEADILELMELRYILDPYCTKLFAERANPDEIEKLKESYYSMLENRHNSDHFNHYSNEFHLLIAKGTQNNYIIKVMEYLQESMLKHQDILLHDLQKKDYQIAATYHYKILKAIQLKDSDMAESYCKYHIRLTIDFYKETKSL